MLKDIAYYKTGGSCENLHEPESIEELSELIKVLFSSKKDYFIIGGGTNSLVLDQHFPGDVIAFTKMNKVNISGNSLTVEAGVDNTVLAQYALNKSLAGITWMNRLPGQLGGTVRMNARCYGGEISQVVDSVTVVTKTGDVKTYQNDGSLFKGYKDTIFMKNGDIIASAEVHLNPGEPEKIKEHMDYCEQDRISKGQFKYPSCGCVFKNDYSIGVPSGMLLDEAGAHKLNTKTVGLNPKHANFVFNQGAGSREILEMTFAMRDLVFKHFGVWLHYEMEILGKLPPDLMVKVYEYKDNKPKDELLEPLRKQFKESSRKRT